MNWWQRLWRRKQMEQQLERELRFHLEQHANDLVARGIDPIQARRLARLALGGPEQVKEQCRDARGTRWLDDLFQDVRYAIRMLGNNRGFAAVALVTLALGTGATAVMFTVVNGVLLKPLPYHEPHRLVALQEKTESVNQFGNLWAFAYPNFLDCRHDSQSLAVAAWRYSGGIISASGEAEYVDAVETSSELFSVLGVSLLKGRAFLPEEDRLGAAPVVIISYELWQHRFAGNPAAVGAPLVFDGTARTIVGITPPGFRVNENQMDVFTPLGQNPSPNLQRRDRHPGIAVLARLHSGVTLSQAQTELAVIGHRLAQQYPQSNAARSFVADPLRPDVGDVGSTLWLLLGAVSLVLLIACVNVASLLLARAVSRERELAMRVALGAGRGRLVRQCLAESAVLALAGGALGILLAQLGLRPFVMLWPGSLPRVEEVHLDWRVILFAIATSLVCGVLFGLAPALRAPSRDVDHTLRTGGRTVAGSSRRLHGAFVVSEVALAVVLLVSAGMLGRTLLQLSALNPGLNFHNVLISRLALSPATVSNVARIRPAWKDVLDRARHVPGVQSAAIVDTVPLREGNNQVAFWITPWVASPDQAPIALATSVTPDYLDVMGIPLLKGRFFDDHDRVGNELVVVIDDVLAKQAFGANDPIGQRLWIPDVSSPFSSGGEGSDPVRVVGVVGHVRHWGLAGDDQAQVRAQFYYSFAQVPDTLLARWSELMSIAVRTNTAPLSIVQSLRQELRGASNDQALYGVETMEGLVSASLARQRFLLSLFAVFAGLALLLACIGIYGVLAYLTGQRVPEIGVRIALGARPIDVMWMVLRQGLGMILAGIAAGIFAAFAAGRVLQHLVEGMRPAAISTFAVTIPLLIAAALFASFVPARRASRVDPMTALRQE
jgi:predicted permease